MLIGIVSDIHDALRPLTRALSLLRERGVERFVTLGDAFESYERGAAGVEIARRLRDVDATGVWGNHDFGLSYEVTAQVRAMADPELLTFASRLQPQLVVETSRFCHIEPWKDPHRLEDLWLFDGVPETGERAQRSFQAVPERILFVGHFHSGIVVGRDGRIPWDGTQPIRLAEPDRYLVLVPAVLDGWCATFETTQSQLTTIRCA